MNEIEDRTTRLTGSKGLALASLMAALYAVGVILLAPISFQPFQVRVADALLPLAVLFGPPAVLGLTLGTVVANSVSMFGPIDIAGGTLANFLATYLAWRIGRINHRGAWALATLVETLVITLIVGTYLAWLANLDLITGWLSILGGSLVAINLIGYPLLKAVHRTLHRL